MSPFSSTCRGNLNQLVPSPPQALTPFFASLQSLRKHRLYPWFINSSNAPPEFNPVRRSYAAAPFHFLVLPQSSLSFIHQTQIQQNKIESGISAYWIQTGWREKNIDKGKGKMKEGKKKPGPAGFFSGLWQKSILKQSTMRDLFLWNCAVFVHIAVGKKMGKFSHATINE